MTPSSFAKMFSSNLLKGWQGVYLTEMFNPILTQAPEVILGLLVGARQGQTSSQEQSGPCSSVKTP